MTNRWPRRIAEAGVAVSMIMLLGGLSQAVGPGPGPIVATMAAVGLLLFGLLLIAVGRSGG